MKNDVQGLHGVKPCLLNEVVRQEPNKRLPLQERQACFSKRRGEGKMKNGRLSVLVCLVAIIALGFGFAACGGSGSDCDCDPKAHLGIGETCDCGGSGCNCTVKEYGKIASIPIYREKNVTDEQATDATKNILAGYAALTEPSYKNNINTDNVIGIHITLDRTECLPNNNGKNIIYLAYNEEDIKGWLWAFNDYELVP